MNFLKRKNRLNGRQEKIEFLEALRSGKAKLANLNKPKKIYMKVFGYFEDDHDPWYFINDEKVSEAEFNEGVKDIPASQIVIFS